MMKRDGFTIIEDLVAMVIFLVVGLALLSTVAVVYRYDAENNLRNTAIKILQGKLDEIRSMNFSNVTKTSLDNGSSTCLDALNNKKKVVYMQIRNARFPFGLYFNVTDTMADTKIVNGYVCWRFRGKYKEVKSTTIIGND